MFYIDAILFGATIYMLVLTFKMRSTRVIPSFFINNKINLERAHDKEGYINYMVPRIIVFSVILMVFAVIGMLESFISIPPIMTTISGCVYFLMIIVFGVISVKAQNKYLF